MRRRLMPFALHAMVVLILASPAFAGKLYLKSGTIDTDKIPVAAQGVEKPRGIGHYIVQFSGPITLQDKTAVTNIGAVIIEYIPDNAFVVRATAKEIRELKSLKSVEWLGKFKPAYKHPQQHSAGIQASGSKNAPSSQYVVTSFPGYELGEVAKKLKNNGARIIECKTRAKRGICRILATEQDVSRLIQLEEVAWVEPYVQPTLCNDVASAICGIPEVRQNLSLYGQGQIVGVADAGLDTGDPNTISPDFAGRILSGYGIRRPGDWSDLNGHGTHVVGSLLGAGVMSGSDPAIHNYSGSFAGYAPEAQLVFQSIGDDGALVFPPLHLAELFQPAYQDGARIHSNSWGSAVDGEYTVYSNEVDQFAWDHKDFLMVFAVGNEAEDLDHNGVVDLDTIYAPATAKNCISVGATESDRTSGGYQKGYGEAWPSSYPSAPIKYDPMSNNPLGLAAFSGRGPTDDGRIKPDICAPGTNIISCRNQMPNTASGWGLYNSYYIYWGGTSMSTPQVAGAAALVREYYVKERGIEPSAALVKATLINGATDIAPGQYGTGSTQESQTAPDNAQGWGRLNVKDAIFPQPPTVNEFADESAALSTGEYRDYLYTVVDNSVPLQATLVWTDYPGAVHAAKELVNDLDMTITSPTGVVYPQGGFNDHTNNVERITINTPELGTYRIRVNAFNVPMGPQDYALVVSGGLPITYISGTVTSSSGAGVPGATVSLVSSTYGVKHVVTNLSGKYVTRVNPGTYYVQVGKSGWTFSPRSRNVQVVDSPVENVDFTGTGDPGSVSGSISSAIGGIVSKIVETPHPYLNSTDQTYIITGHQDATRIRVHFAEIDLMEDGDTIYVTDANDVVKNTFTGRGEDIWSSWVTGNTLKIRIITNDYGNIGYGFYVDGYETDLIDQGALQGATVSLSPGGFTATTNEFGEYTIDSVPPGVYTVTPNLSHWKFEPGSKSVEVPAGGVATGIDFTAFPPGSISGEVRISSSEVMNVNVQSPHPYPDNYEEMWTVTAAPSVTRIRLHFDRISTEPAWDFVYLMDEAENIIEIYTAEELDFWTPWINGNVAKILLASDSANNDYGFYCDAYETETLGSGLDGVEITLTPDGRSTTTSGGGFFLLEDVDVGAHTVTPSALAWTFDPIATSVNISPGMQESLFFFAQIGVLNNIAQAKTLSDTTNLTLGPVTVSAVFDGYFYVQDTTGLSGIKVISSVAVTEGASVTVQGMLSTINGERQIEATNVTID